MRCHYEVLNVPQDAGSTEIKTAYRKCALKWHPDKNLDNADEAKKQFQLIQQAYEVLIDPQERCWYDRHREQIIRGSKSEFQDQQLDVFQYFTTTCFKGYGDDEKGFYGVYSKVFDKIINEDMEFVDDKTDMEEMPRFGNATSDYNEVVAPFYSYWMSYCTKRTYVWLDPVDVTAFKDRMYYKYAEKENKKVRQAARKERNEEVRNLVAFVRKRDRRVIAHCKRLQEVAKANRTKQQERSVALKLERQREIDGMIQAQADWSKFENMQTQLEAIEKTVQEEFSESDEDDAAINEEMFCIACSKVFRTPKSFKNHELSKKHKENIDLLKNLMLIDEASMSLPESDTADCNTNTPPCTTESASNSSKKKTRKKNALQADNEDNLPSSLKAFELASISDSEDFDVRRTKKTAKRNRRKNTASLANAANGIEVNDVECNKLSAETDIDLKSKNIKAPTNKSKCEQPQIQDVCAETNKKMGKIKFQKEDSRKQNRRKVKENFDEDVDTEHCCVTCRAEFSSKNKLFNHLKATGHGVYLDKKSKA